MRILIAEDSKEIVKILEMFLKRFGHEMTIAWDGQEAIDHFDSSSFDLVITDYRMPKIDGLQLLKMIRDKDKDIPVILVSADKNFEKEENSTLSTYIIKKPFSFSDITKILDEVKAGLSQSAVQ